MTPADRIEPAAHAALASQAGRGAMWALLQNGARHGINFLVFLLLARLLAPEGFGLVAMASAVVLFVNAFVEQGLGEAIVQRAELTERHLYAAFWANLGVGTTLALIMLAVAHPLANAFGSPDLAAVLQWLAPCSRSLRWPRCSRRICNARLLFVHSPCAACCRSAPAAWWG